MSYDHVKMPSSQKEPKRMQTVPEIRETRQKRMAMRSWRRGTKEMDLILGPYADAHLRGMDAGALDHFEALLEESDQDLYPWITGAVAAPDRFSGLLADIMRFSLSRKRGF